MNALNSKKYQFFISSTYRDLYEERKEVTQIILQLQHIPVGMELFPAANEDQWTLIKDFILNCDYYILIVGSRYGSEDEEGISYTQKEYQFALENDIPIISFLPSAPDEIHADNTEESDEKKEKLKNFKELVRNKVCKFYKSPENLKAEASASITDLIKRNPRTGWIKADKITSAENSEKLVKLMEENKALKEKLEKNKSKNDMGEDELPPLDDKFILQITHIADRKVIKEIQATWREICKVFLPQFEKGILNFYLNDIFDSKSNHFTSLDSSDHLSNSSEILAVFGAYNLIRRPTGHKPDVLWTTTEKGNKLIAKLSLGKL